MNIQGSFPLGWTGLISLLDLLRGTFKSLLQHHSLKPSILRHSAFRMVQLSHPYMSTRKNIALTTQIFVSKVMSLFSNMLIRVCHSFPSKKWASFNFMASVTVHSDFGAQENEVCHCFHCFPIYLPWSDGTRCHDLSFFNGEVFFFLIFFIMKVW